MIAAGSRLGPYEIRSALGAGGMGEVWRACDTRLGREVAVKVLPAHLSSSAELRGRFEREAKTISALSHPNICALYDVGNQDGVEYLVMELLEGETLAQRLLRGALPLERVLTFGSQIASALAAAHRRGVVHRDLKPGNIMLTASGVKLLDFGLAKAFERSLDATGSGQAAAGQHPTAEDNITALPTVRGNADLTQEGTILGTFQYMAPEQLEGKPVDARTDLFALGVVLYEMATGKKAFAGASQASLISSIMTEEPPPISASQPLTPPALDGIVRACLAKDPEDRWQSARDVQTQLAWISERRLQEPASVSFPPARRRRERIAWALATAFLLAALAIAILPRLRSQAERPVTILQVLPPPGAAFAMQEAPRLSPDGRRLAFVAVDAAGRARLYVRPLDSVSATLLSETDGASMPFWSPDSRSLAFFAGGKLKVVGVAEGRPRILSDAPVGRGGAWNQDGSIIFVPSPPEPPELVPASGGAARPIPLGDFSSVARRFFPDFLPDARRYLFLAPDGSRRERTVRVGVLGSQEEHPLLDAKWSAAFARPDYVLFRREAALFAQRFDLVRLQPSSEPFAVASDVGFNPITWQALFSVSSNGTLAYQSAAAVETQLVRVDRGGREIGRVGEKGIFNSLSLSPDGKRVAYDRADPTTGEVNVWLVESEPGSTAPTRFTFGAAINFFPIWSPDGTWLVFATLRQGPPQLYQKVSSGAGDEEPLLRTERGKIPTGFSPDGRYLVYAVLEAKTGFDLWVLPLFGDRRPFPFLQTEAAEVGGQISPNGRWMAYASNESGAYEIYVRPFPPAPGKWQVSREGGSQPRWRADGRELFYISTDRKMMAVQVQTDKPAFESGAPQALFETRVSNVEGSNPWSQYGVSADGHAFLVNRLVTETSITPITVVLNWKELEKKRVSERGGTEKE
jgi:serine/threonine protein kinase/Tol biopolymer transport system component